MNEKDIEAYERGRKAVIDEAVEMAEKTKKTNKRSMQRRTPVLPSQRL